MKGARFGGRGRTALLALVPAAVLLAGVAGRATVQPTGVQSLRAPLETFPERLGPYRALQDEEISPAELRVLRPDDYLKRRYAGPDGRTVSLFTAYYGRQLSGATIHSPRNCLPGSGWQPVSHTRVPLETPYGTAEVNRYLLEHERGARALVFYWYQGRGRVGANEYLVKWELLRDAIVHRRTDEALVRVVVPLARGEEPDDTGIRPMLTAASRALVAHLPPD